MPSTRLVRLGITKSIACGLLLFVAIGLRSLSVLAAEPPGRWIVVTAPAFRAAVEPLRQHRADEGFQVALLTTTDVLSRDEIERGDGRKLCDEVHKLCRSGTGKVYVLLVGATAVARDKDALATVLPVLAGTVGRMKDRPTDNGYGCLGPDLLPTVAVGRLPARTAAEAEQMVQKILAFERGGRRAPWRRSLTLLIGNPGGDSPAEQALANWYINGVCRATAEKLNPCWHGRAIYHIPESPWYVPDANLHDQTLQSLQQGQAFTFYLGHSGPAGFWSGGARFLDRTDWATLNVPHGAGVFITCGCFACQLDPAGLEAGEGYGVAAIRNPGGPAAVVGAVGESYAAAGQLAFNGLLGDFAGPQLPERLGDVWLDLKSGIAKGPMDFFTFTMFDHADGSHGTIPMDVQRQEHLEMWMLLGDPALRLPAIEPEITLEAPQSAAPGATVTIRGTLPAALTEARVRVTLERPAAGQPQDLEPVPAGPPEARNRAILANHQRANNPVLLAQEIMAHDGRFDLQLALPATLPWAHVVVRATVERGETNSLGVVLMRIERPAAPPK